MVARAVLCTPRRAQEWRALPSTRRMEKTGDRFGFGEFVVKGGSLFGRQDVHRDLPFFQERQRLSRNVKALSHSTREHDYVRAVIEQLLDVGDLNSWSVTRLCLAPIPFARAAGEKLCVFVRVGFALDLEPAP